MGRIATQDTTEVGTNGTAVVDTDGFGTALAYVDGTTQSRARDGIGTVRMPTAVLVGVGLTPFFG